MSQLKIKLSFGLILLFCSSSLWAEQFAGPQLQKLISEIQKITFKKTKNPQQVAGRVEFTDVDVEIGGFPLELHNRNFQDGYSFFDTNIYLKEKQVIFEGVNRVFVLSPAIDKNSFIKSVEEAEILNITTHINERRFKVNGEKFYFTAKDIDVVAKEFYFLCNKKQMDGENDITSIINDCWTDGKIRQDYNRGAKTFDLSLNYRFNDGNALKINTEINQLNFNAQERIVSYQANSLKTHYGETMKVVSGPLSLDCRHSRKRSFTLEEFKANCLDDFKFHQDRMSVKYVSIPTEEELNLDPHKEKAVYEIFLENSGVSTTDKTLNADIDVFSVEEKSFAAGLYNLDLKCNKSKNFAKLDTVKIVNTCLENATVVKRAEDKNTSGELSQAKIQYRLTENKTDFIDFFLNINKISSQIKNAEFDLDLFEMNYLDTDGQYNLLFPKAKMSCTRKFDRDGTKIKIIDDCLEDNAITADASLIDEIDSDFKLYLRPIDFKTNAQGLEAKTSGMQYYDQTSHMNILGFKLNCQLNGKVPNQIGQSEAEIMEGCVQRGHMAIDKFKIFDNGKKTKSTSENIRELFTQNINPLDYDNLERWDLRDIKVDFKANKFEISSWVKLPPILAGQEFIVTGSGTVDYEVATDGKQWLNLRIKETSIRKLIFPINGDSDRTTFLIVNVLKLIMPEKRIIVNRKCENPDTHTRYVCNQVSILMN
ncbi:MAG: hypothetical protein JNM93_10805 [Bacteriovoracaceae bacterium]|nr:hypothetical protein [Bacteriovoracaceae bacterium]